MNQPIPFNLSLARQLAEYSRLAYTREAGPTGRIWLEAPRTSTTVLVEDVGDAIVLAFRGTKEIRDWLTDLQFAKKSFVLNDPFNPSGNSDIKIHVGFLQAIDSILPEIIDYLLPPGVNKAAVKPLLITGHSLGGSLAALAAYFLAREGFNVDSVYTFASPRVGNAAWRDAYQATAVVAGNADHADCVSAALLGDITFRVVCAGDLVPLIPGIFTTPMDGYRHVGTEVLLDGPRLLIEPSHYIELALDGWRAYWAVKAADVDFILDFHSITNNYLASLNRAKQINL